MDINSILVVCIGNICRSPMAAALLKKRLPQIEVSSAGLGALVGEPAHPYMRDLAKKFGVELNHHQARQLEVNDCLQYSLILAMENEHITAIQSFNFSCRGRVMLFGHWLDQEEVLDPYQRVFSVFEECANRLDLMAESWQQRLLQKPIK